MGVEYALVNDEHREIIDLGKGISHLPKCPHTMRELLIELTEQTRGFAVDTGYALRLANRFFPILERWHWNWREVDDCGEEWDEVFYRSTYELVATRYENADGSSCLEEERSALARYRDYDETDV